jgi:hypothetical protein
MNKKVRDAYKFSIPISVGSLTSKLYDKLRRTSFLQCPATSAKSEKQKVKNEK